MLPLKGLYRDTILRKNPEGFTPDARNVVIDKMSGVYTSEPGNEIFSEFAVTNNLQINGIKTILYGKKIIMSINLDTNLSEIGILDGTTYTPKIQEDLGFDINFPFHPNNLQTEFNFKGELILAFSDNLNTPKIVNLDNPPSPFDISKIQLFPSFKTPNVESDVLENSGSLLSGVYYPAFKYKNNDGTTTSYTVVENPIYIVPSDTTSFRDYEGSAAAVSTTKAIRFTLTNVDTSYDRIVLAIIYKQDGVFITKEIKDTNVGATVIITYTGTESTTDISVAEIIVPPAFYNRIKHLTQVQGTLYGADVSEDLPVNLQKYATLINLKFKSTLLPNVIIDVNQSYKVNEQNNKQKGYMHEEVYAFYLIGKLKRGGWTRAFHIPNRAPTTIQGTISGQEDDLNSTLEFQDNSLLSDIAVDSTSKYYQTRDTTRDIDGSGVGTFGLWLNEDELYPTTDDYNATDVGGEDLRGQKVRHFRFPSIKKLKSSLYSANGEYGRRSLDVLGLVIDNFPTIPTEISDIIEGFQICYAKRSISNSTVAAQDLVIVGATRQGDVSGTQHTKTSYSSGGNWKNVKLNSGGSQVETDDAIVPNPFYLRFHAFDLLYNKPAIRPSYLSNQLSLHRTNIGVGHTWAGGPDVWGFDIDFTATDATSAALLFGDEQVLVIKDFQYVPSNVQSGKIFNYRNEECAWAELTNGNNRLNLSGINGMKIDIDADSTLNNVETYLTNIMLYKKNLYDSFYGQDLALTGLYFTLDSIPSIIYGGDTFISMYSFVTFAQRITRDITTNQQEFKGVKTVYTFICESPNNIGFRYEVPGDESTKYYPKQQFTGNTTWLYNMLTTTNPNKIAYNKDYSSVNDLNPFVTFNPFEEFVSDHFNRIIRSVITTTTEKSLSWQTFLANDFFDIRKDMGKITNIQGIGDNLLINLETTILKTRGNETLKTGEIEAFVGSGNIFDRQPIELQTDDKGIGGCQSKFSCLLTPAGYFFVDIEKSKPYLVSDKLVEITEGLFNEFLDTLNTIGDNPFIEEGLTVAWDDVYERIILSQIDSVPMTYSYSPKRGTWTQESDCRPKFLFNDRKFLFSLKGQVIYKHNAENKSIFYGVTYPSYVVNVFRLLPQQKNPYERRDIQETSDECVFKGLQWKTEVIGEDGQKLQNITLSKVFIWNSYQATNEIEIVPFDLSGSLEDNFDNSNTRRIKDKWIFNKFRDLVVDRTLPFVNKSSPIGGNINVNKSFELRKRFTDDFLAVKFLFSNELIDTFQPEFHLVDIDITLEPTTR